MIQFRGDHDTICALATPEGKGALAVIRVSGPAVQKILSSICPSLKSKLESHRIYFTAVVQDGEKMDEVLVSYFSQGHSYTGEESFEISCHGGRYIVAAILRRLVFLGCRTAERGEFTYRAYRNNRIDLIQAESVLALIESESAASSQVALSQLSGGLSRQLQIVETELCFLLAQLEAMIDFSHEDLVFESNVELVKRLSKITTTLENLVRSYRVGRLIAGGVDVAIVGRPNVGKSSLLNALLGFDRAIVTEIAGTTRDVVEGKMVGEFGVVNLSDTAGLRQTDNPIESEGVLRARALIQKADLILWVLDQTQDDLAEDLVFISELPNKNIIFAVNKADKEKGVGFDASLSWVIDTCGIKRELFEICSVSAKTGVGIDGLKQLIFEFSRSDLFDQSSLLTNARHYELAIKIVDHLTRAADPLLKAGQVPELAAFELQSALEYLYELLGKKVSEEVMDYVFNQFCIGK